MPEKSRDRLASGVSAVDITSATALAYPCRGVWIGTTQSLDFSFDAGSTWVKFQGATAGTIIPIMAYGARKTAGSAAPTTGDVVFLY